MTIYYHFHENIFAKTFGIYEIFFVILQQYSKEVMSLEGPERQNKMLWCFGNPQKKPGKGGAGLKKRAHKPGKGGAGLNKRAQQTGVGNWAE